MPVLVNPVVAGRQHSGIIQVYSRWGSEASPLVSTTTGSTAYTFAIPVTPVIPAGIIQAHSSVCVLAAVRKVGATATAQFDAHLGTAGTTSDSLLARVQVSAGNGQVGTIMARAYFNTATTSFLATGTTQPQASTGGGTFTDRNNNVNTAAQMYITLAISSADVADSFQLQGLRVWIEV